jgi:galactoside alpha-1,3-fucosyltransferase 4
VVIGGGNYSNPDLAIPGSYINALDFKTVEKLANYLKYLDKNDQAYSKYFEWRKHYKRVIYAPWTCTLCAALNMNTKKTYISRLSDFWSISKQCGLMDNAMDKIIDAE